MTTFKDDESPMIRAIWVIASISLWLLAIWVVLAIVVWGILGHKPDGAEIRIGVVLGVLFVSSFVIIAILDAWTNRMKPGARMQEWPSIGLD